MANSSVEQVSRVVVGGQTIIDTRSLFSNVNLAGALRATLEQGVRGYRMPIFAPLPVNASPAQSAIYVFTDRPGVKVRLCSSNQHEPAANVQPDGYLLRGDEDVYVNNSGAPDYYLRHADGSRTTVTGGWYYPNSWQWINLFSDEGHISVMAGTVVLVRTMPTANTRVNYADSNYTLSGAASGGTPFTKTGGYVFGPMDYVNLGCEGDGRIFSFWCNSGFNDNAITRTAAKIRFISDPYRSDVTDAEMLATADWADRLDAAAQVYQTGVATNYFEYDFDAQIAKTGDQWSHVVCPKDGAHPQGSGFTKTGNPLWSRITGCYFVFTHSDEVTANQAIYRVAGLYFGTPADGYVRSLAQYSRIFSTRTDSLVLEFDAPTDSGANVVVVPVIS